MIESQKRDIFLELQEMCPCGSGKLFKDCCDMED